MAYWPLSASIRALVRGDHCPLVCIGVPYIIVAGSIAEFGSHDTFEHYEGLVCSQSSDWYCDSVHDDGGGQCHQVIFKHWILQCLCLNRMCHIVFIHVC